MEPRIQYAQTADGVSIAFCVAGDGPPLLFVPPLPFCHVQLDWESTWAHLFRPLAQTFRFVWYDSRGTGLSDRDAVHFSMEAMVRDADAVVERTGFKTFAVCSVATGTLIAVTYAAAQPERVSQLVLADAYTKTSELAQLPAWRAEKALREQDWALYTDAFVRVLWGFTDDDFGRQMGEYFRACVEPEAHRVAYAAAEAYDVSASLPRVTAPTLVVQNRNFPFVPVQCGQRLASRIPNARFLPVDDPTYARLPALIAEFVSEGEEAAAPAATPSGLVTILFTDMEGSTALTQRLGDAKAQEVLRTHNTIVRDALGAHGGSEIKHTGDGIMASFPSASGALECAIAIQRAVAARAEEQPEMPLRLRIGLNAGEPVVEDQDLFGTAVQLAARVCAHAEPGQILAPTVVRELAAGKGFLLADLGQAALRGFEDPVRLYEVRWREA